MDRRNFRTEFIADKDARNAHIEFLLNLNALCFRIQVIVFLVDILPYRNTTIDVLANINARYFRIQFLIYLDVLNILNEFLSDLNIRKILNEIFG